jgi:NAD(P)-dependent dehydrogenase (short-subunit alcohol dehydrogenase family)
VTLPNATEPFGGLAGKVAAVTGGGSSTAETRQRPSVGFAIAAGLARAGLSVAVVDVDAQAADRSVERIRVDGQTAAAVVADITDEAQAEAAVAATEAAFGGLDVLVNCAALLGRGSAAELDVAHWRRVLEVNLTGTMLMTRFAVPAMRRRGGGSIVNISSTAAQRGFGTAAYAASKGGMEALTIDTATAYGRDGIRCNVVVPGYVDSPMATASEARDDDRKQRTAPLGTAGYGWDVAAAVAFFASDGARWCTGSRLVVDAGLSAVTPLVMLPYLT